MLVLGKQVAKFGLIGIIATLINNIVYHFIFITFEVSSVYANTVGFVFAFAFSFAGSVYFTFSLEYKALDNRRAVLLRFINVAVVGLFINTIFAFILVDYLNFDHKVYILFNLFVTPCLTFFLNKVWVFKVVE